jgi:ribose 1,5-bisphosphokinase
MGAMVAVVGPSGVGKDSILQYAAERLKDRPEISFVRRTITRAADSGGELHDAVDDIEFAALENAGHFAVTWQAHDLRYGIPRSAADFVSKGGIAIVNGSRHALDACADVFPTLMIVSIVADKQVIAKRLHARGRESTAEIEQRLKRPALDLMRFERVFIIDNSSALENAGDQLVTMLEGIHAR